MVLSLKGCLSVVALACTVLVASVAVVPRWDAPRDARVERTTCVTACGAVGTGNTTREAATTGAPAPVAVVVAPTDAPAVAVETPPRGAGAERECYDARAIGVPGTGVANCTTPRALSHHYGCCTRDDAERVWALSCGAAAACRDNLFRDVRFLKWHHFVWGKRKQKSTKKSLLVRVDDAFFYKDPRVLERTKSIFVGQQQRFTWWQGLIAPVLPPGATPSPSPPDHFNPAELRYDVGIALPTFSTCLSNLYHGTTEFMLPLFHTIALLRATFPHARKIAVFPRWVVTDSWGKSNSRCIVRNYAPYGFGHPATTAFMFDALRASVGRLDVFPLNERRRWSVATDTKDAALQQVNVSLRMDTLLTGLPTTCFGLPRTIEQTMSHALEEYPYAARDPPCDKVRRAFRDLVVEHHLGAAATRDRVTDDERRCPRVVFISRSMRANGRAIVNEAAVLQSLRAAVPSCGSFEVVHFEKLGLRQQLSAVRAATVLVGPRGAGMVHSFMLRDGAGMLIFGFHRDGVPIIMDDSTSPWTPLGLVPERLHVVVGLCRPIPVPKDELKISLCKYVSTNYCNGKCDADYLAGLLKMLLAKVQHSAASYTVPSPTVVPRSAELRSEVLRRVHSSDRLSGAVKRLFETEAVFTFYRNVSAGNMVDVFPDNAFQRRTVPIDETVRRFRNLGPEVWVRDTVGG